MEDGKQKRGHGHRKGVQALSHFGAVSGTGRTLAARWQCLGRGDTCWYGTVRLTSPSHCPPPETLLRRSPGPAFGHTLGFSPLIISFEKARIGA